MENICVCCGEIIPEGRQVCKKCEQTINEQYEVKGMNNETIKKMDITIKLRGEHVYDLYVNGRLVSYHGNIDSVLNDIRILSFINF